VLRKLYNVGKIQLMIKKTKKKKNQMGKENVKDLDPNLHDLVVEVHHVEVLLNLEVPVHDLVEEVHHVEEVYHQKDEVHLVEEVHRDVEVLLLVDQTRHDVEVHPDVVHLDGEVHQVTDVGVLHEKEVDQGEEVFTP